MIEKRGNLIFELVFGAKQFERINKAKSSKGPLFFLDNRPFYFSTNFLWLWIQPLRSCRADFEKKIYNSIFDIILLK